MYKIIQHINTSVIRYPFYPTCYFNVGEICRLGIINGVTVSSVSNGINVYGFFGSNHTPFLDDTVNGMAAIFYGECIIETDSYFVHKDHYPINATIFVNNFGLVTTVPFATNCPIVGYVEQTPTVTNPLIIHWTYDPIVTPFTKLKAAGFIKKKNLGMNCNKCKEHNEYAESNQEDGSFKCWRCSH